MTIDDYEEMATVAVCIAIIIMIEVLVVHVALGVV